MLCSSTARNASHWFYNIRLFAVCSTVSITYVNKILILIQDILLFYWRRSSVYFYPLFVMLLTTFFCSTVLNRYLFFIEESVKGTKPWPWFFCYHYQRHLSWEHIVIALSWLKVYLPFLSNVYEMFGETVNVFCAEKYTSVFYLFGIFKQIRKRRFIVRLYEVFLCIAVQSSFSYGPIWMILMQNDSKEVVA